MIGVAMYTTIKTLWNKTKNKSEIARITGHDWKTVSKAIKDIEKGIEIPTKKPKKTIIDDYMQKIITLLQKGLSAVRIHEELLRDGFKGSYPTVKKHVAAIKKRDDIFIRIHTDPGEEAQVDFGYLGITKDDDGKNRKTWVFNMRLSHSRLDYYEKVYDQKVDTFVRCHINAFEYFGGVPEYVRIDNLKAAILVASFYEPVYQVQYKEFAAYYGFSPIPCRVRKPNDKGKVESGIKFVKGNFFCGRTFKDGTDLDRQLREWLKRSNNRIHGTTRKVPLKMFMEEEASALRALPPKRFKLAKISTRKVYHDCHVYVDYNYYSVPYEYIGKKVDIELTDHILKVFYCGSQIALHQRIDSSGKFSTINSHYPAFKILDEDQSRAALRAKIKDIGEHAVIFFDTAITEKPKSAIKIARGVLSLQKKYPAHIIDSSCRRAIYYGAIQYQIVKNICANAAYTLPLEEVAL